MENKEMQTIAFKLDSEKGRVTKLRILRLLKEEKLNAHIICRKLNISSYSHISKFLNQLYSLFLVDYIEIVCSNEYINYKKKEWFLTELGIEFVNEFKDLSLNIDITPKMFKEKLKRQIRSSEQYKKWREEVLKLGNYCCKTCGEKGESIQAHHLIEFSDIIEKNKIDSFEKALLCEELFDVNNGECLCSYHHLEKHNPLKCHKKS
jgi:predicted transcriptional regulator